MLTTTDSQTLGRMLALDGDHVLPENAHSILALKVSEAHLARVQELGEKCNEGTLTEQEREEYAAYVRAGVLLDTLKARAMLALRGLGKTG
jgi:hypothetical protein